MSRRENRVVKKRASAILCIVEALLLQKIMLFGSYAYGAPAPDGDVDRMVIMESNQRAARIQNTVTCEDKGDGSMRTSKKVFWVLSWVLVAGGIVGIGYHIWFLTTDFRRKTREEFLGKAITAIENALEELPVPLDALREEVEEYDRQLDKLEQLKQKKPAPTRRSGFTQQAIDEYFEDLHDLKKLQQAGFGEKTSEYITVLRDLEQAGFSEEKALEKALEYLEKEKEYLEKKKAYQHYVLLKAARDAPETSTWTIEGVNRSLVCFEKQRVQVVHYPTALQERLFSVTWYWFALTLLFFASYAFVQLLRRSGRNRLFLLHVLAVIALVGVFNPDGMEDILILDDSWIFALSAAYLVFFAYWRFIHFMRARNSGKTSGMEREN